MNRKQIVFLTIIFVLLLDQSAKIWVKTHLAYGEEIQIFGLDWALIHFVENNGMAFGISLGGDYGKLFLTLFRIIAVSLLFIYLNRLVKESSNKLLLFGFALIQAGALGNIIDSVFYGLIFSESSFHGGIATLFPETGGYAPLLYGRVVDMLYFPILYGNYPPWIPIMGGKAFVFFRPVFNIADVAISGGATVIVYYYLKYFVLRKNTHDGEEE